MDHYEIGVRRAPCTNKIHAAPAGWCPDCDSHWDVSDWTPEAEIERVAREQVNAWRSELDAKRLTLRRLDEADRTPAVIIARVECRRVIHELEEKLAGLEHQCRKGGEQPREREPN